MRARLVLALAVLGHLAVLYAPSAPSTASLVPGIDKVVHVAVFAVVVWAARWAGSRRGPVVAVLLAHAGLSEVVQHTLLPGRSGDPLDVLANAAGVLLGAVLAVPGRAVAGRMGRWRARRAVTRGTGGSTTSRR